MTITKEDEYATAFGRTSKKTKVDRYGWKLKDKAGKLKYLSKSILRMHPSYQRQSNNAKVITIASDWSWVACGAIIVGERGGEYWVIDGQHRVLAARRRADIDDLPCLVFATDGVEQEAKGFLDVNTLRKSVSSIDKFRALMAAGDPTANYVNELFVEIGITPKISGASKPLDIASVGWSLLKANENREAFEEVIRFAADLCRDDAPLHEILLGGLYYVHTNFKPDGLRNKELRSRIKKFGHKKLVNSSKSAAAYYQRGGAKVWARGMIDAINKGLHNKFEMKGPS